MNAVKKKPGCYFHETKAGPERSSFFALIETSQFPCKRPAFLHGVRSIYFLRFQILIGGDFKKFMEDRIEKWVYIAAEISKL